MSRDGFRMGQVDLAALRRGTGGRIGELGLDPLGRAPGFYQAPAEDTEAARVLAEADRERRERAAEQRALESLAGLTDEDGSPMVQPERGLGPQLGVRSVDDIALEDFAGSPGASAALSLGEVLPLPLSRVLTGAATAAQGGSYDEAQRELDRLLAEGREENPRASLAGMGAGMLPQLAAAPLVAASSPLLARLGPTGARIAAGTLEGMLTANAQDAAARRPLAESSVPTAAMLGMGFGTAAEGVGQLVEAGRRMVPSLESFAKPLRVRGSAARTLQQMRAIDELPGGTDAAYEALTSPSIDGTVISPRGSVHSMGTAAERARHVNQSASRALGRVFDEMAVADEAASAIVNSPRNAALEAVELDDPGLIAPPSNPAERRIWEELFQGRVARSADQSREALRESAERVGVTEPPPPQPELPTALPTDVTPPRRPRAIQEAAPVDPDAQTVVDLVPPSRRHVAPMADRVRRAIDRDDITWLDAMAPQVLKGVRRPSGGLPPRSPEDTDRLRALVDELLPQQRTGTVALDDVLSTLDERARTYEPLPSGAGPLAAVRGMSDDYRRTGGRMTFRSAQDEKKLLDQAINYNPNTNPVNPRASVQQDDVRVARQALNREMEAAVQRHDPELGTLYPRAKREHAFSGIVGRVGDDAALRDAANRQVSLTDYMSRPEGLSVLDPRSWPSMIGNYVLRGRESTLAAAGAERLSDALQAMPNIQGGGQRAARAGSLPAGQPARAPQMQPAGRSGGAETVSNEEFQQLMSDGAGDWEVVGDQPVEGEETVSDDEFRELFGGGQ